MDRLWDTIDISENIERTLKVVRGMRGVQAFIMAVFCFIMFVAACSLAWTFDIKSTLESVGVVATHVSNSLPQQYIKYSAYTIFAITFAPSLFEMGGAAFARGGNTPFQGVVIALSIFDLLTDAIPCNEFVSAYWPAMQQFGIFAYPLYWIAWAVWLLCSSFLFEMVAICLGVATVMLIIGAIKPAKQSRGMA